MLHKGTEKALITSNPTGGQTHPNSMVGHKLLVKYAQKKEKKKKTSETINKIIPVRNPV